MSIAEEADGESALEERVIDRSGDIDQRPAEEKSSRGQSNITLFKTAPERPVTASPRTPRMPRRYSGFVGAPARPDSPDAPSGLHDIAIRLQRRLNDDQAKARSKLENLARKIEAQEKRCIPPKLDEELHQLRFQRQKIMIANGPHLAHSICDERSHFNDLERFKAENRLTREAHYASSPLFAIGLLLMLTLAEAAINGVLFADASEEGLLGGWLEALVLAMANIGAAFLLGRLVFTQLHRRGLAARSLALAASLFGIALIFGINLFGAHYRDYKAQLAMPAKPSASQPVSAQGAMPVLAETAPQKLSRPKSGNLAARSESAPAQPVQNAADKEKPDPRGRERDAIASILRSPLQMESFASVFLLVIGLCGATIAAWDGYRLDDPYPGYGRCHRRYIQARARKSEALNRILSQCGALMGGNTQAIARKIEDYAQEVAALEALHQTYAGERKALQAALEGQVRQAEEEMDCQRRILCKSSSRADEYLALTAEVLPELNEKHAKFYETQERKLKALRKLALKEQDEILSMLEAASGEFQKLLSGTAHESLRLTTDGKDASAE